jgi:hypothetical protein
VEISAIPGVAEDLAVRREPDADAAAGARARRFLAARVGDWPVLAAAKAARLWWPTSERAAAGSPVAGPTLAARLGGLDLLGVWSVLSFPLALWGIGRILTSPRRWYQSLALMVLLHATVVATVFYGALRMRLPIEPLIALYAAAGFEAARRRVRSRLLGLRVVEGHRS